MTVVTKLKFISSLYYNDPPAVPPTVPPPPPPPNVPPPPPTPVDKVFTQAQVDKLMEDHRKGLQNQNKELIEQLEALRGNVNLTTQEKEALEARIQTLSQQHLTKDQQQQEAFNKLQKKYETDTKALVEKEGVWKSKFELLLVDNGISSGAVQHKARSAEQLQMMLRHQAKVVEEVGEDGKPTGNFVAKLTVETLDPKTKQKVKLELPIAEAIGKLREDERFQNLFDMDGKAGLGGSNYLGNGSSNGNGSPDFGSMSTEQFMAWRTKQSSQG